MTTLPTETLPSSRSTVLVTGCGGFIGYRLCLTLLDLEYTVVGVDECNSFYDPRIKRAKIKDLICRDRFRFFESLGEWQDRDDPVATVFHLAGQASISYCQEHPEEAFRCNDELTKALLKKISPSAHVIFVSSSSVYGNAPIPWTEHTPPLPKGEYASSKFRCENLVRQRGAPATILRPFSIIGAGIRPDLAPRKFLNRLLQRDTIEIFGDGNMRRDFTHVDDFVEVTIQAMKRRWNAEDVRVYPIGAGHPRSVLDLLSELARQTKRSLKHRLVFCEAKSHEVHTTHADSSRARIELGFNPRSALETGVRDILAESTPIEIVVVVATKNREHLLRSRALPSIQAQTLQPSKVCIVVDEDRTDGETNMQQLQQDFPGYSFIYNNRTKGASGAWNSGVFHVTDFPETQFRCYLGILDDDDTWEPNHLEACLDQVESGIVDWVISGITRHTGREEKKQSLPNPEELKQVDFIVGNPHVQGSNLFLSLRLFYRAGMFDENLPSTTDRDLCIRLFDVAGDLAVRSTRKHTVHHYADFDRMRLSAPGSSTKCVGLQRFACKHLRRVDDHGKHLFWKRAHELFNVTPSPDPMAQGNPTLWQNSLGNAATEDPKGHCSLLWTSDVTSLLFGVISHKPQVVSGLIEDISKIPNARLLLLANSHSKRDFKELMLRYHVAGEVIEHSGVRLAIAQARSLLQEHCGHLWAEQTSIDAVVIMDDDKRIPDTWFENLRSLLRSSNKPSGGYLGPDVGAPPLPAAFTARTNLLDFFYQTLGDAESSSLTGEDLFYDLNSKITHHLEFPLPAVALPDNPMECILKGCPISREAQPNEQPVESTERGGCCVVLERSLLHKHNPSAFMGNVVTRRSDMLWTKISKHTFVKHPALCVHHYRTKDPLPSVESFLKTAKQDLLGSALCRPSNSRIDFLENRLKQLAANTLRIEGLLEATNLPLSQYFSYNMWVEKVIRPVWNERQSLAAFHLDEEPADDILKVDEKTKSFVSDFRRTTAKMFVAKQFGLPSEDLHIVGCGSEGVIIRSSSAGDVKYKVLDGYRPRKDTFKGDLSGLTREPQSTVLVSQFIAGELYSGGGGPEIVRLLRQIQDEARICFRNWKPANLVQCLDGKLHFVDFGRDVVAFDAKEFEHMVKRAYLSWRFPNHGPTLKQYFRQALTLHIPQLDGVEYLFEAIADRKPDRDLYDFVHDNLKDIPHRRILDFGCGRAKFQCHTKLGNVENYDPFVSQPGVAIDISQVCGLFDLILCLRVLCVLSPDDLKVTLDQIRHRLTDDGMVMFTMCDPRGVECEHPEETFAFDKTVVTGRTRTEWYRPLRIVRIALVRAGFEVHKESVFWRVDQRRFERKPNQWCCLVRKAKLPRHTLVVKTCLMEHATIEQCVHHLVETLPCGSKTILVLDGKNKNFLRGYAEANDESFKEVADRLLKQGWIDELLLPPTSYELAQLHLNWFSFTDEDFQQWVKKEDEETGGTLGLTWTHNKHGAHYASTFHAFDRCEDDLVLQVDSDLMIFGGPKDRACPTLPYSLFDEDPQALTWALPIANHKANALSTGHRLEVRGCLISISRLNVLFRAANVRTSIGNEHWYRLVDRHMGEYLSYRGGQMFPFFVHPQNDIKKDMDRYFLAVDAVQSRRLHPLQVGNVDFLGMPTEKRTEPFVIVCCGRNVPAGRVVRCIDSIRRNMDESVGLVVIDDASCRQNVEFLQSYLPTSNTTFVSRRVRAGSQANLFLACSELIEYKETIICTVDMDDTLLGEPVPMIRQTYKETPTRDAAFGGLVHANKPVRYEIDAARPIRPREARGQPYWTHLRTFKKVLFDRICEQDLHLAVEDPLDWAFCVPIWEQAQNPAYLNGDLYLYEPSSPDWVRPSRDAEIGRILAQPGYSRRRPVIAVIGDASVDARSSAWSVASQIGRKLAEEDFVVMTGGLGGVMEAACRGAKEARGLVPCTVGILPGTDPNEANAHVDVAIATGLGKLRNGVVALAQAVVVVGGGEGTRSEVALAWAHKRLIISMKQVPGCSSDVAGKRLDKRIRYRTIEEDQVFGAANADEVVQLLRKWLPAYNKLRSKL